MAVLNRLYKKFLLSLIIMGSITILLLSYHDGNHPRTKHICDGLLNNKEYFRRSNPTISKINVVNFSISPPDKLKFEVKKNTVVANNVYTPGLKQIKVNAKEKINVTNTNASIELTFRKKTFYPVTVYAPYIIENPTLCSSVPNLSILVIVHTAPQHFDRRDSIRLTWTNETYFKHIGRVRVLFLLGKVKDEAVQKNIEKEFAQNGDLLQGDFIDDYHNLTHKGVMAYKWMTERCRNAKLILKVDDDVTVNMYDMLTKVLPKYQNQTKQMFCDHILPGTMPILRQNTSKWYVDETQFRGRSFYPRYCRGFTVIFTNDIIPTLYRASAITPFFWVDDVYLYGLVPGKLKGIKYNGFKEGDVQLSGIDSVKCYENKIKKCTLLIGGGVQREIIETLWMYMTEMYKESSMINSSDVQADIPNAHDGGDTIKKK